MPKTDALEEMPRKELHVFYVLDTSGSMIGTRIAELNRAMEECTSALKDLAKKNGDAKLKIAVLEFNSNVKWITNNGPELLEDFEWESLEAGGLTSMGAALRELDSKLSRDAFLSSMTGALMPVIIFMTDGIPTDDYERPLSEIRKNKWFIRGTKIGFAIGEIGEVDEKMIASVVGNSEAVIHTNDLELFKKLMRFVSVTASMLSSKSHTKDNVASGSDIVSAAKKEMNLPENITSNLSDNQYNKEPEPTSQNDDSDSWDDDDNEW